MDARAFGLLFCTMLASPLATAQGTTKVEVRVAANGAAAAVELQGRENGVYIEFERDATGRNFIALVPHQRSATSLLTPFDLVIDWPDPNEVIFLNIGTISPPLIRLDVQPVAATGSYKIKDLDAIDGLGGDHASMLEQYVKARRFHLHWRHTIGQPDHAISLRSARIWFDASVNLAKRRPEIFRRDDDIARIVADYRSRARSNGALAGRVSRFFPAAMLASAEAQIAAAPYQIVGEIPGLIRSNRLDLAKTYNDLALASLENADGKTRALIAATQNVTIAMLRDNSNYIDALTQRAGIEAAAGNRVGNGVREQ